MFGIHEPGAGNGPKIRRPNPLKGLRPTQMVLADVQREIENLTTWKRREDWYARHMSVKN